MPPWRRSIRTSTRCRRRSASGPTSTRPGSTKTRPCSRSYGYAIVDVFARAAAKDGADLSTDTFIKVMDSMVVPQDIFGTPEMTFTARKHLGSEASRLSQIVDGRWKVVSEYVAPVVRQRGFTSAAPA